MEITLKQVKAFLAVAEHRNFRKASEVLNLTQPPLSKSIKDLEFAVGTVLFTRTTRSVELTPAGDVFLSFAQQSIEALNAGTSAVALSAEGRSGRVRLTYSDFAILDVLPRIMTAFGEAAPDVEVVAEFADTDEQVDRLLADDTDIAFVSGEHNMLDTASLPVEAAGLVAVLRCDHRLASAASVSLAELRDERFIAGDLRWDIFNKFILDQCRRNGFTPKVVQTAYFRDAIFGFVLAGMGIALYSDRIVNSQRQGLVYVPVQKIDPSYITSALWKHRNPSKAVQLFAQEVLRFQAQS